MLFYKPIQDVTWDDIDDFCQKNFSENAFIEYKRDFPKDLEKTLAAMANTTGGLVLIGVEETNEAKPQLPLAGMDFNKGLEERVHQIIFDNITPPFLTDVAVCQHKTEDKAIVVIRVPQSSEAPHAIIRNTQVYFRTGNRSTPEELLALDKLEWLLSKRKKSVQLKEDLITQAGKRYNYYWERFQREKASSENPPTGMDKTCYLIFACCPSYPASFIKTPPEMKTLVNNLRMSDYYGTFDKFPVANLFAQSPDGILVKDGVILPQSKSVSDFVYSELNSHGLFFVKYPLGKTEKEKYRIDEFVAKIDLFIQMATKLYKALGHWGPIDFNIKLTGLTNKCFQKDNTSNDDCFSTPDDCADWQFTVNSSQLNCQYERGLLLDSVKSLLWSFDLDLNDRQINALLTPLKGA